ncbi:protein phosphatase 2C domain-containing protein [Streptacidiphilus rugosus]|uniref:protein phosphatase 2C domain-containing protein n=1 Tax=Streptacidiphilus rugosus TaxID=405783 RepID=UPI0005657036|nr:protein phosphatase 2C domain-containing protein [Streptacidiphilus rugosus]
MEMAHLSKAAPGAVNEDYLLTTDDLVVVMDGVTPSLGPSGCIHDVPWLTRNLAGQLAPRLITVPDLPLDAALHQAVTALRELHQDTCDLDNPDSPATTVSIVRRRDRHLDYLALADSPVVIEKHDGQLINVLDHRPKGYWVAGTRPEAAHHAVTGTISCADVRRLAVMTDGTSRLVDKFDWTWHRLLDSLQHNGPTSVIQAVRAAERAMPTGFLQGKRHDDATIVYCQPMTAARKPSPN